MPAPIDDGWLLKFSAWIVTALLGFIGTIIAVLGGRVIRKHDEEIASIKKGIGDMADKFAKLEVKIEREFVSHDTYETNRQERRDAEIGLHEKISEVAADIHKKIEAESREQRSRHDQIMTELLRRRDATRGGD